MSHMLIYGKITLCKVDNIVNECSLNTIGFIGCSLQHQSTNTAWLVVLLIAYQQQIQLTLTKMRAEVTLPYLRGGQVLAAQR